MQCHPPNCQLLFYDMHKLFRTPMPAPKPNHQGIFESPSNSLITVYPTPTLCLMHPALAHFLFFGGSKCPWYKVSFFWVARTPNLPVTWRPLPHDSASEYSASFLFKTSKACLCTSSLLLRTSTANTSHSSSGSSRAAIWLCTIPSFM
jgi:hypothetical protein